MNKVGAVGFEAKEIIRYNCYIWMSHFSKLEFLEKCHRSYIKHHNLKRIKIIDENVKKKSDILRMYFEPSTYSY